MTITYRDGRSFEAVLLAHTENQLRAAIEGNDDITEFSNIHGIWVSEDCEPVSIEFAWQKRGRQVPVTPEDCCCSRDLAARLIHLLYVGGGSEGLAPAAVSHRVDEPGMTQPCL